MWCYWYILCKEEPKALLFYFRIAKKNKCKKIRKNNLTREKFGILIMCKENVQRKGEKNEQKKKEENQKWKYYNKAT